MAKIIAFYGSPGSGKTTVALKSAIELYCSTKDVRVAFVSPDFNVPSIGLLFPNHNPDDIYSLSKILDNTDVTEETLLEHTVSVKSMKDFGFFGLKSGDGEFSFPALNDEKITSLFNALSEYAEYVFVDCSNDSKDFISKRALETSDISVRMITPDTKGMSWLSVNKDLHGKIEGASIFNIVSVTDRDLFIPTEEVCTKFNSILVVMPYSRNLKQQMLDGRMYERFNDKAYNKRIKTIVSNILISEGQK